LSPTTTPGGTAVADRPGTAPAAPVLGQRSFGVEVWTLFLRNFREGVRSPVIAFLFPVLFPLLAETLVSASYSRVSSLPGFPIHPYTAYMAPGMLLLAGMMGSGYSATALILDVQTSFLDRLKVYNVRPNAILASRLAFDAVRVLPAAIVVLLGSMMLGAHVAGPGQAVGVILMCSLWSVGYGGLFYIVALTTWNPQAPLAMAPLFILLMFTSPAFVPGYLLPPWLVSLSHWNPFTYIVEGCRAVMYGDAVGRPLWYALAVLIGAIVLTQAAVIPLFRRAVAE